MNRRVFLLGTAGAAAMVGTGVALGRSRANTVLTAPRFSDYPNLSNTALLRINLSEAVLLRANLDEADLTGTTLQQANLNEAILSSAILQQTDLTGADLTGADLTDANLEGAEGITTEDLEEQAGSLEGTTMPDGTVHN